jgi:hypothetical protein
MGCFEYRRPDFDGSFKAIKILGAIIWLDQHYLNSLIGQITVIS